MYRSKYLHSFIGLFFLLFGLDTSLATSSTQAFQEVTESDSLELSLPKHNGDLAMDPARQLSITTTEGIQFVMMKGRLYNGDRLNEIYTRKQNFERLYWQHIKPNKIDRK